MGNNPKVSIIIPFYNGCELLQEAVESALNQSYSNLEIIVVNDGSPEDMSIFLTKYGARIKYIVQKNKGAAAARNMGISYATGEYIAFLDSDDIWLPTKLQKQIAFMQETGVVMCHTGFYYWFPEKDELKIIDNSSDFGHVKNKFYVSMRVATPSVVISRSLLCNPTYRFPEYFRNGEDTQFYRLIANDYPIALLKEPLVKVRMRKDNSFKKAISRFETNAKAFDLYKNDSRVPFLAKFILSIYWIYHLILGDKSTPAKEKIAFVLWTFPFSIERIYTFFLSKKRLEDEVYLK